MPTSKISVIFFLLFLFIISLHAQDISVGFVGGYHLSGMEIELESETGKEDVSNVSKMGAGLIIDIPFGEIFSVRINPIYLSSGFTYYLEAGDMDVDYDLWAMPIHLKKEFGDKVKPYIFTGPIIEYVTNAPSETVVDELGGLKLNADMSPITKDWHTGIDIGGGISIPIKCCALLIEGVYAHGILNMNKGGTIIFKNQGVTIEEGVINRNDIFKRHGFRLLIGFSLPLNP
jgi:hypothetical protein